MIRIFFVLSLLCVISESYAQQVPSEDTTFLQWKIRCKGLSTGREKIITGNSKQINQVREMLSKDMENVFDPKEKVFVEMKFLHTDAVLSDTLSPSKLSKFWPTHTLLLSSCETYNYPYEEWLSPFYNNPQNVKSDIDKITPAPEGSGSFFMGGADKKGNNYVSTLTKNFQSTLSGNIYTKLQSDEDNTWIFFYAYGKGDHNAYLQVLVSEKLARGLTENRESFADGFVYNLALDFIGWKQFAIRYSDLRPIQAIDINNLSKPGIYAGGARKPDKIACLQYNLMSVPAGSTVSVNLDKLMILYNK